MPEIINNTPSPSLPKRRGRPPKSRPAPLAVEPAPASSATAEPPSPPPKPGARTTEFWTVAGALVAALATTLTASDREVQLAALGSLTVLGSVLGGIYIRSRTRVKAGSRPGA